jgi:hypothetical protein
MELEKKKCFDIWKEIETIRPKLSSNPNIEQLWL